MDRTIIEINCDNNIIGISDPDFNIFDVPIKEKKSMLVAQIAIKHIMELMQKSIDELLDINMQTNFNGGKIENK